MNPMHDLQFRVTSSRTIGSQSNFITAFDWKIKNLEELPVQKGIRRLF
jgi:hypothetical protein